MTVLQSFCVLKCLQYKKGLLTITQKHVTHKNYSKNHLQRLWPRTVKLQCLMSRPCGKNWTRKICKDARVRVHARSLARVCPRVCACVCARVRAHARVRARVRACVCKNTQNMIMCKLMMITQKPWCWCS